MDSATIGFDQDRSGCSVPGPHVRAGGNPPSGTTASAGPMGATRFCPGTTRRISAGSTSPGTNSSRPCGAGGPPRSRSWNELLPLGAN